MESALSDLQSALAAIDSAERDEAYALAEQMADDARALLQVHKQFLEEFNGEAVARAIESERLMAMVADYHQQRLELRNALLGSQQRLRELVPNEYWPEIRDALADKGDAVAAPRGQR